jgi:hypothetical protein
MTTETVEEAIDKYVHERMAAGKEQASERFLAYAYLKHGGDELREFLKKVRGLTKYYIDFLKLMENPFKGPELAWFASMVVVGIYSCYLVEVEESRAVGIFVLAGTLVHASSLICMTAKKWSDIGVTIAIYREIVQIVENELVDKA